MAALLVYIDPLVRGSRASGSATLNSCVSIAIGRTQFLPQLSFHVVDTALGAQRA